MKRCLKTLSAALLLAPLAACALAPSGLKTEFLENPIGIDTAKPRFSWIVEDSTPGARQTAYQLQAASNPENFGKGIPDLWDSGRVESGKSHLVEYTGRPLASRQRVWWRVRVWPALSGAEGGHVRQEPTWSVPAHFEIGLLQAADWSGRWIKAPGATNIDNDVTRRWKRMATPPLEKNIRNYNNTEPVTPEIFEKVRLELEQRLDAIDPAPLFRKSFKLEAKPAQARVHISGLGLAELRINGRKVGDELFSPAATPYEAHAYSITHDVTSYLRAGENVIAVIVSPGGYNQPVAFATPKNIYGRDLPLFVQLEVRVGHGTSVTVGTDESWKTSVGPILKSSFWLGEAFDATRLEPGWDAPGFDDSRWAAAVRIAAPTKQIIPQMMPAERIMERVKPVELTQPRPGIWVYKFPKAITGMVELNVSEPRGTPVCVRYSERLFTPKFPNHKALQSVLYYDGLDLAKDEADGMIGPNLKGIGVALHVKVPGYGRTGRISIQGGTPTDLYIANGQGPEVWSRRAAYTPFQFVEVTGLTRPATLDTVTALVVHADLQPTGSFSSSNKLFNRIVDASLRSLLYCTHEHVEDNPGREKGWYAIMAVLNEELAVHNRDYALVFRKLLDDYRAGRRKDFGARFRSPSTYRGQYGGDDAYHEYSSATLPMVHFRHYGDRRALEASYEFAKGFVDYYWRNPKFESLVLESLWPDYPDVLTYLDLPPEKIGEFNRRKLTPNEFATTAKIYEGCRAVMQMAELLGKTDDAALYRCLVSRAGEALNAKYYDAVKKDYGSQAMNSLAVMLGFAPEADRQAIADNTVKDIDERFNGHIAIGHMSLQYLFQMLSEYGHVEKAYALMNRESYPSLGQHLKFGTQTIGENWAQPDGEPSLSSTVQSESTGHVEWFYKYLCGLRPDEAAGGYKHFFLAPVFPEKLTSAGMKFQSPYGKIGSAWKREGGVIRWSVIVPWNTTATIKVPGFSQISVNGQAREATQFELPAGRWDIALQR